MHSFFYVMDNISVKKFQDQMEKNHNVSYNKKKENKE